MAITDKDVKKLSDVFATKSELLDINARITSLQKEFVDLKGKVMGGFDKVLGELEKAREDRTLAIGKDREQDRGLDNLENRMEKVEART